MAKPRIIELQELERLGLIRPQTFPNPIAYYGGQGFIASLDKQAALNRQRSLELQGADAIKQKFPLTYREFWPGI